MFLYQVSTVGFSFCGFLASYSEALRAPFFALRFLSLIKKKDLHEALVKMTINIISH